MEKEVPKIANQVSHMSHWGLPFLQNRKDVIYQIQFTSIILMFLIWKFVEYKNTFYKF